MAEFTADASHELKTPICAMKGEAEVLLSRGRTGEEYQEGLAHFVEQFDRLNQMIDNLILLSKFDSTEVALRMVPLRLDLLVKDIANLFEVLAEQKKLAFSVNILQEVTVLGDKTRLQQLFTNLIDNAIKYTLEGSIRITLGRNGETAEVKITDTGIGIPEEEQKNIFKRFYRVDKSRSKETGGAGLGLSIAEWIAHAHHGKVEVLSGLGEGSTLAVTLPLMTHSPKDHVS
jgi:signal transduction histidine kinase